MGKVLTKVEKDPSFVEFNDSAATMGERGKGRKGRIPKGDVTYPETRDTLVPVTDQSDVDDPHEYDLDSGDSTGMTFPSTEDLQTPVSQTSVVSKRISKGHVTYQATKDTLIPATDQSDVYPPHEYDLDSGDSTGMTFPSTEDLPRSSVVSKIEAISVPDRPPERVRLSPNKSRSAPTISSSTAMKSDSHLDVNYFTIEQTKSKVHKPEAKIAVQEIVVSLKSTKAIKSKHSNTSKKQVVPVGALPVPIKKSTNIDVSKSSSRKLNPPTLVPTASRTTPASSRTNMNVRRVLSRGESDATSKPGTGSTASKKKLIVRGLKKFVDTRGSCPPSWVRDFPCKSKYHPDSYIYDWEEGPKAPGRPSEAMSNCTKKGARCGTCGIYSDDSCRCCRKCPLDCQCPKPPTKVPDVMSQAFGSGWSQAKRVICELTESERRGPVGGNAAKMHKGVLQHGDHRLPHLQCNIDILNPERLPYGNGGDHLPGIGGPSGQPQQFYPSPPQSYYPSPPQPYCYYPQMTPQMYPGYYQTPMPPTYMSMPNLPMSYPPPTYYSDQNYSMMSPYPTEHPPNY